MSRSKVAAVLVALGLVSVAVGLVIGLRNLSAHVESAQVVRASGQRPLELPSGTIPCGSALAPSNGAPDIGNSGFAPFFEVRFESCTTVRHPSLVSSVALLSVGPVSLFGGAGLALQGRRRPDHPDPAAEVASP